MLFGFILKSIAKVRPSCHGFLNYTGNMNKMLVTLLVAFLAPLQVIFSKHRLVA